LERKTTSCRAGLSATAEFLVDDLLYFNFLLYLMHLCVSLLQCFDTLA